jgi:hypothetical protein
VREIGGGADNDDNSTPLVNDGHKNTQNDGGDQQRHWAVAIDSSVGIGRKGSSGENNVLQWRWWVVRVGTQQSINNPLQWTMTKRWAIKSRKYVRGEQAVDNTTRGGSGRGKASGLQTT